MNPGRKNAVLAGAAIGLAAAIAAALTAPAGAASTAPAGPTTSVVKAAGGYLTTVHYPNGDSMKIYSPTPYTASTPVQAVSTRAAADGAKTVHTESGTLSPTSAPLSKDSIPLNSTVTAYDELVAMGVSPAEAAPYKQLDAAPQATTTAGAKSAATVTPNSTVVGSPTCVDKSADGGQLHMHGCNTTYKIGSSGAVWYLQNRFLATGTMHDTAVFNPDEITGLKFGVYYGSGNKLYNWSPASTRGIGSCSSNTVSVAYKGVGISSTTTECPETFGVYDISSTKFTAKWDGEGSGPNNGSRETHGVDSVYNGASASPYAGITWQYWYE